MDRSKVPLFYGPRCKEKALVWCMIVHGLSKSLVIC